jgi:hypothetical protein
MKPALAAAAAATSISVLAQGLPSLAEMTPGHTYYNMRGASVADHDREVVACAIEAFKDESGADAQLLPGRAILPQGAPYEEGYKWGGAKAGTPLRRR